MKPPFVRITAECSKCGKFTVDRKPNKNPGTAAATYAAAPIFYSTVKCPKCPYYADILDQQLIVPAETFGSRQDGFEF
jgi:ssDNA-binding Zn-finger/Zn-ribbon topoisomerase 1